MNRRNFFKTMIGGVAATAAVRTWPFRVYSFPTEIVLAKNIPLLDGEEFLRIFAEAMRIPPKKGFGVANPTRQMSEWKFNPVTYARDY